MRSALFLILATMSLLWLVSAIIGVNSTDHDTLVREMTLLDQFKLFFDTVR